MHPNANVTYNTAQSAELYATILGLQPRAGGGGGAVRSPDEIVTTMCDEFEALTPEPLDADDAGETTFVVQPNGLLPSLAIVLQQEMVKFNRLLDTMRASLANLKKAIAGFIVMSGDLVRFRRECRQIPRPP